MLHMRFCAPDRLSGPALFVLKKGEATCGCQIVSLFWLRCQSYFAMLSGVKGH